MFQATELVYEALLRKDIKCRIREAGGMSMVEVTLSGRNFARASIYYISNTEGNDVAVRTAPLVKFPSERLKKLYAVCNAINRKYRHAKFVVDPDKNVVTMEMDIPSRCENVGAVAEELLVRAVSILDAVYPQLMQATWA